MRHHPHIFPVTAILLLVMAGCRDSRAPVSSVRPRVVSLAPNLTEIVCALDAHETLVGRTSYCKYPPEKVRSVPIVGGFGSPSLEILAKLKPTLVIDVALEDEALANRMEQLGIQRRRIPCKRLDEIPDAMEAVGILVGKETNGRTLARQMNLRIAETRIALPPEDQRPKIFAEIWSSPLMTAGKQSFVADLVRLAGGKNIGDESDKDYYKVSSEWVVSRNPDIIIITGMGSDLSGNDIVKKRSGWQNVSAVRNGRVYACTNAEIMTIPGPRVLDALEELQQYVRNSQNETP